jgi:hypothetical protein
MNKGTNSGSKSNKAVAPTAAAASSVNSPVASTAAEFVDSAAMAIKLEPAENLSKFDEILKKRKAERLEVLTPTLLDKNAATSSNSSAVPTKKAKLSVLQEKALNQSESAVNSGGTSSSSSFSTPPRSSLQPKTLVQFNIFCVEGEEGEEIPVAVTICNIFGLKDILLGNLKLPSGDYFYWPTRMFYAHQVNAAMDGAGNIHPSSAQFLQTSNGRPLIVLSRLSKVKDNLLSFDEVVEFLQTFIQGRIDESSNGTPKRTFELNIVRRVLTEVELDALVAISARIVMKAAAV